MAPYTYLPVGFGKLGLCRLATAPPATDPLRRQHWRNSTALFAARVSIRTSHIHKALFGLAVRYVLGGSGPEGFYPMAMRLHEWGQAVRACGHPLLRIAPACVGIPTPSRASSSSFAGRNPVLITAVNSQAVFTKSSSSTGVAKAVIGVLVHGRAASWTHALDGDSYAHAITDTYVPV